jgi:hypothetical protein
MIQKRIIDAGLAEELHVESNTRKDLGGKTRNNMTISVRGIDEDFLYDILDYIDVYSRERLDKINNKGE